MAARLFLALVGLIGVMWYLAWYQRVDNQQRNRSLLSILLYGTAAALLILVLTGRIPWLFALFGAAVPWINRALTVRQMWNRFNQSRHNNTNSDRSRSSTIAKMTREEAYKILDLPVGASQQDIIDAHRRLIQKIHPDRGGSDFLAAQINQAKDTLLNQ
ncbi:DnaJ domain-containing protein [Candidatus Spongiihabitans sp.]|uniref:DnaJ domain-containing protein n=1 Tax=Candidatus Spongiihabitans sp. TaxID=3101308 RepID=UPI003C6F05BC